jgi:ribosomal protein S18 acetylase RimI-like enzyme
MTDILVLPVENGKKLKELINLPSSIYKNDPLWVPPLRILERMDYKNNTVLNRSKHKMFLAYKDGKAVGRIIAYIDPHYNDYYSSQCGMIGGFECIDDNTVAELLFKSVDTWFRDMAMNEILGPINPIAESWGFLLEGSTAPIFMSPHNPLYYNRMIESAGFTKAKDLLVYEADMGKGYEIPERFRRFSKTMLKRKPNLKIRNIDRKNLNQEALHILNILNRAVAGNWGYVPVEKDEMKDIVLKLKYILDEKAICFVEDNGVPVAVVLGFPDINVLLKKIKGRLNPRTLFVLQRDLKKIRDYRLWGLAVLPEYQGQGLDVLLYISLFQGLQPRGIRLEANYMLEDNPHILNALEKMNLQPIKRYRVYHKNT